MWQENAGARRNNCNCREEAVSGAMNRKCNCREEAVSGAMNRKCNCREEAVSGAMNRKFKCDERRRPEPVRGIEDILDDILESVNNIEECTCDRIVRLLKRILDALEDEDDDDDKCHGRC